MNQPSTDQLIAQASKGDRSAVEALLEKHREKLHRMVALQMDDRIKARVGASDVVQETMIEATRRLPDYLQDQALPFYPWLRQIAAERLKRLHRYHIATQKRSVKREARDHWRLNDSSSMLLVRSVLASQTTPSGNLSRKERRARVQIALKKLSADDQEILVLRHLEKLSTFEIAAVLGITETAAKSRHFHAIHRLQNMLGDEFSEA